MKPTEESFLRDVGEHGMIVLKDDGVYRHLRFKKPESGDMFFDIVTWPGYLAYSGDMGCYVFSRIQDMFQFFRMRRESEPNGRLSINLGYWAEKCEAKARHDGIKEYCPNAFREQIEHWLESRDATDEVREEVKKSVLCYADDGEHAALRAAHEFEHKGFRFTDFWEADCTKYTYRYIWCCYALAWGIRQYDASKTESVA